MCNLIRVIFLCFLISLISATPLRQRRQIDFNIQADHDDKVGTDLIVEAMAKLWRSKTGNTQIDGTAKVIHQAYTGAQGNTKYSGKLHISKLDFR
uniref:Attacin C-terminal domain-containing protein n=1 Tax=Megaselia scalaris TaxID=36166 RepID=T1GA41_MEGSC